MAKDFDWVMSKLKEDELTESERDAADRLQDAFCYGEEATDKMIKRWEKKKIPRGAAPNNKVFLGTVIMGLSAAVMNVEETSEDDSFYTESESDFYH